MKWLGSKMSEPRWIFGRGRVSGRSKSKAALWPWVLLIASPMTGLVVAWLWHTMPDPAAAGVASFLNQPRGAEQFNVDFDECSGPVRDDCVVDGDTFWLKGEKVRIADINTPEVSEPQCPAEAALGAKATQRLIELLNGGGFSMETVDRDEDRFGRKLRIVTRGGDSLGEVMVTEGLAERWRGYKGSWC